MWRALKLETLVWAHMYDDTVRYAERNDATLSIARMIAPKIEPEIVVQAEAPARRRATPAAVLEAVEWLALGFEIIDCVFPDWKFQPADFVAAFGLHAALDRRRAASTVEPADDRVSSSTELAQFTVRLLKNDELVEEGVGEERAAQPGAVRRRAR